MNVKVPGDVLLAVVGHLDRAVLPAAAVSVLSDGCASLKGEPLHHVTPNLQTFL